MRDASLNEDASDENAAPRRLLLSVGTINVGPITLFDKSFLQSLTLDESVFFDQFFTPVISPIFYVETLADLEKTTLRPGRTPEDEVRIIADKVPDMHGSPCIFHLRAAAGNLFGHEVPMNGHQIPRSDGRTVEVDGKVGVVFDQAPEDQALARWQDRQFLDVERRFAKDWRSALNRVDLLAIAKSMRVLGITPKTCRSIAEAREIVRAAVRRRGTAAQNLIQLAFSMLGVPPEREVQVLATWRVRGKYSLSAYAPYTAHVMEVELFSHVALGADLIGTADTNNRTDIAYLFYTPFCRVFVSSDSLHRRCAPAFLGDDRSFVWGQDLKADLKRLAEHYQAFPEREKEQGLMKFATTPPRDDHGLVAQLWDRHFGLQWRSPKKEGPPKQDKKLIDHINRVAKAPAMPRAEAQHVGHADPQFVQLTRRYPKRKGSWWQLPKDYKE